jgi:TPR repeat protein
MLAWRLHLDSALTEAQKSSGRNEWMLKSANSGLTEAMFKVARTRLGEQDLAAAMEWFRKACRLGEVDACYQLAQLLLTTAATEHSRSEHWQLVPPAGGLKDLGAVSSATLEVTRREKQAVDLFEVAAAAGSSPFGGANMGMYNLGVAHLYGYGGLARDPARAAEWFQASTLPEGMMALSLQHQAHGKFEEASKWESHARRVGFGTAERTMARKQGFDLHSQWPKAAGAGAQAPPKW